MSKSLTTAQLADRWSADPLWITRQARAGNIPGAWKLGQEWRFLEADIEAYELSRTTHSLFALTARSKQRQRTKTA